LSRREFLQYGQGAALAFLPSGLWLPRFDSPIFPQNPAPPPEFHVHPIYKTPRAIEAMLKKARAEFDAFPTEIYQDQIAKVFEAWAVELRASPAKTGALESAMSARFAANSLVVNLQPRRKDEGVFQVWDAKFQETPILGGEAFVGGWRSAVSSFSKFVTVEFQITGISADAASPDSSEKHAEVHTRVRYEFVGEGRGFYREQWIGDLDLDWELEPGKELRLHKWRNVEETRSRSQVPVFEDIAAKIFASCPSFGAQFVPGVDTWRTVLDGASGIDIYGHNGVAAMDSTICMFANPRDSRTGCSGTAGTGHSRTPRNPPEWVFWITQRAPSLRTLITTAGKT
jgi:hypothetical protein